MGVAKGVVVHQRIPAIITKESVCELPRTVVYIGNKTQPSLCSWEFSFVYAPSLSSDFEVYFLRLCFAPLFFRISFAQTCHENGLIADTEWNIYCDWHSFLLEYLQLKFDGFIYFKSTPEVRPVFQLYVCYSVP